MVSRKQAEKIALEMRNSIAALFQNDRVDAILFGSYARDEAEEGSDIDVMLLVDQPRSRICERNWEIGSIAADFLLDYGIVVSPVVENRDYFRSNAELFPFYRNIIREGVYLRA